MNHQASRAKLPRSADYGVEPEPLNSDLEAGYGIVPKGLRGHLTAHEIAVYVALSWRANFDTGICWLRQKRLAEEAGMSPRTVQRVLESLRAKRIVTWWPKYGSDGSVICNVYRLNVQRGVRQSDVGDASEGRTEQDPRNETPKDSLRSTNSPSGSTSLQATRVHEQVNGRMYLASYSGPLTVIDVEAHQRWAVLLDRLLPEDIAQRLNGWLEQVAPFDACLDERDRMETSKEHHRIAHFLNSNLCLRHHERTEA